MSIIHCPNNQDCNTECCNAHQPTVGSSQNENPKIFTVD